MYMSDKNKGRYDDEKVAKLAKRRSKKARLSMSTRLDQQMDQVSDLIRRAEALERPFWELWLRTDEAANLGSACDVLRLVFEVMKIGDQLGDLAHDHDVPGALEVLSSLNFNYRLPMMALLALYLTAAHAARDDESIASISRVLWMLVVPFGSTPAPAVMN